MARDLLAGKIVTAAAPAPRDLLPPGEPGSREYADWAAREARAGRTLPPVGPQPAPVAPEQQRYDAALETIRRTQFPQMDGNQWANYVDRVFKPDLGALSDNGSTFGLADEISSLLGATGSQVRSALGGGGQNFGDAWNTYQELENARLALARQKSGMLGTAIEMGTGLATMGPERAVVDVLANGGRVAAAPAVPLLETALKSGATGAGVGGIGGLTNADGGIGERAMGAVGGTIGGAAVGTAFPVVARGVSAVAEALMQTAAGKEAAARLGMSPDAARFLQNQLAADDTLGPGGRARMASAGQEATLADAGPAARNVLDYAIQKSGAAGAEARQAVGSRVSRDAAAINDALDNAFGQPRGAETAKAEIRTTTAPARGTAYDTAYAQPIDYASEDGRAIEELLQRVPQAAVDRANKLMKIEGVKSGQILADVADDGSVTFRTLPDVRQLDYITRALNEEAKNGIGAGAMGGSTDIGSALGDLSKEIRDVLRLHVPEYGDALAAGQNAIQRTQAVQNGYELLRPSTTVEEVTGWARNMTPAQRTDAAQGIRSHIQHLMSNVTRTINDGDIPAREALKALRDLSSANSRDKVALVIGQDAADALFAELDRAARSFELRAGVADNSKTFQRQSMDQQVKVLKDSGIVNTLKKGEPINATKRTIQTFTGATPEALRAEEDAMMQEVVRAMTARGPAALRTARGLSRLGTRQANADEVRQAILRIGNVTGPLAAHAVPAYQSWRRSGAMP